LNFAAMNILGISTPGHDVSVALLDRDSVRFALEEEKLTRLQETSHVPRLALLRCLAENRLKLSDCQAIVLAERSSSNKSKRSRNARRSNGAHYEQLLPLLRGGPRPTRFDHHLCHAASAYYTSGLENSAILTLDEGVDTQSGLLAVGEADGIRPLETLKYPDSLGWFYSRVTELAGFRPNGDERKLQWLAKDGEPEFLDVFRRLFLWKSNGLPLLDRRYYTLGDERQGLFSAKLYRELGLSPRRLDLTVGQRANLARSAQDLLEEVVLQIASNAHKRTGMRNLCVAGGVFLNVLLVRALEQRGPFASVYAQPVAGNAGTALGAAYLARKKITGHSGRASFDNLALGPQSSPQETKAVLDNCKISYRYLSGEEQIVDEAAQLLKRDKIVAWCQGRCEFGHRALGHRSLLASPFSEYVVENINQFIKHREEFHPFALSVPAERAGEYFEASPNCRFMASLATFRNPVAGLERFAFQGNVVRVHTVEREANPAFWKLLHKCGESAAAPILVNTSFNLFGEPLVTDPRGAVRSFYCAGVDALALGPFLLVK
jgi:carbamoyltransferase